MHRYVDNLIAFRILWLLVTPFDKTDAFKLGIIDKDGKLLIRTEDFTTPDQKNAYNYLTRLVFNLKRLIAKVPGGKSILASLVAAYFLIREGVEQGDLENLEEKYINLTSQINEGLVLVEETILVEKFLSLMSEEGEAPVNSVGSGAIAMKDNPMRFLKKNTPKAFGMASFEVTSHTYDGIKTSKGKGSRWDKHFGKAHEDDAETISKIKKYAKQYSKDPIAIKRKDSEHYQVIKYQG